MKLILGEIVKLFFLLENLGPDLLNGLGFFVYFLDLFFLDLISLFDLFQNLLILDLARNDFINLTHFFK